MKKLILVTMLVMGMAVTANAESIANLIKAENWVFLAESRELNTHAYFNTLSVKQNSKYKYVTIQYTRMNNRDKNFVTDIDNAINYVTQMEINCKNRTVANLTTATTFNDGSSSAYRFETPIHSAPGLNSFDYRVLNKICEVQ